MDSGFRSGAKRAKLMIEQPTLEFWKYMALGLKDELVKLGDTIDDLQAKVRDMQTQIEEANELIAEIYDSESLLTKENVLDIMSYMTRYKVRKS